MTAAAMPTKDQVMARRSPVNTTSLNGQYVPLFSSLVYCQWYPMMLGTNTAVRTTMMRNWNGNDLNKCLYVRQEPMCDKLN